MRPLVPLAALLAVTIAAPDYRIRIPMTDGWWDYASIEPVQNNLSITRGKDVFKLDRNTGPMDQRFIPGSEGYEPIGKQVWLMGGHGQIAIGALSGKELLTVPVDKGADAVIYDKNTHRAFVPSDVQMLEQVPTQADLLVRA